MSIKYFKHCHKCTKRYEACHDTCEDYKADLEEYHKTMQKADPEIDKYVRSGVAQREIIEAKEKQRMNKIKR